MPTYNKSVIGSPFLYPPTECFVIRVALFPEAATTMKRSFVRLFQQQGFIRFLYVDDIQNPTLYIDLTIQLHAGAGVREQIKIGPIIVDLPATIGD